MLLIFCCSSTSVDDGVATYDVEILNYINCILLFYF